MSGALTPKPGSAPPRIKGSATVNAVKTLRKSKDRARQLLPPHLHRYLEERILASDWLPEEDNLAIIRALASLMESASGRPDEDVYAVMGQVLARENLSSVYAHVISPGNPEATLRHGAAMWRMYHDTGSCHTQIVGPQRARLELRDYGLPSPEMCRIRAGFYSEVVRMSGGTDVRFSELQCCTRGAPTCILEIVWK